MGIPAPAGIGASGLPPPGDQANAVVTGSFTAVGPGQPFAFRGVANISIYAGVIKGLFLVAPYIGAEVGNAVGTVGDTLATYVLPPGSTIASIVQTSPYPIYTFNQPTVTFWGTANLDVPQITISSSAAGLTANNLLGSTVSGPGIPSGATVTAIIQPPILATATSPGQPGIYQLSAQPTSTPGQVQSLNAYQFALALAGLTQNNGADLNGYVVGQGETFTGSVQLEFSYDGGYTWLVAIFPGSTTKAILTTGTPVTFNFGNAGSEVLYRLNCTALSAGSINYRLSMNGGPANTIQLNSYG